MKRRLLCFVACATLGSPLRAQVTLPVTGGLVTIPTNAVSAIYLTVVSNVINAPVTNIYVTNSFIFQTNVFVTNFNVTNLYVTNFWITVLNITPDARLTPLTNNVIDPGLGRRLVKTIVAPTVLTLVPSFADTNWATLYLQNPNRFAVTWPSTNQVRYRDGPPNPTNDFPVVLFESINGHQIATQ